MSFDYSVEMINISKNFGGIQALKDVTFSVKPRCIHALVGENGAGKSTLIKILSGALRQDRGTIKLDGIETNIHSPKEAKNHGIATIYQEFLLAQHLTVAENMFFDDLKRFGKLINWKKMYSEAT